MPRNGKNLLHFTAQDARKAAIDCCTAEIHLVMAKIKEYAEVDGKTEIKFKEPLNDGTVAFLEANNFQVIQSSESMLFVVTW